MIPSETLSENSAEPRRNNGVVKTRGSVSSLNLDMTAAEMREMVGRRKKKWDLRTGEQTKTMDWWKKYQFIQSL